MKLTWLVLSSCLSIFCACADAGSKDGEGTDQSQDPSKADDPMGSGSGGVSGGTSAEAANGDPAPSGSVCEEHEAKSAQATPDILIVLDRSLSMKDGRVNRWDPSVEAVESITSALDSRIRFGLMLFPGGGGAAQPVDCASLPTLAERFACGLGQLTGGGTTPNSSCAAGEIFVPIDLDTASEVQSTLGGLAPNGFTPTAASLVAAHQTLLANATAEHPPYVLLVTDGAPNCAEAGGGGGGPDTQALSDTVAALEAMASDGIRTFVVGYDTSADPVLGPALDMMAVAGATGDTQHRAVEDGDALKTTLEEITGRALGCTFTLDETPSEPSYVLVQLDGEQLALDDPNGFSIEAGARTLAVQGSACEKLRGGGHTLNVQLLCEPVGVE